MQKQLLPLQSEVCQLRMNPHHGIGLVRGTELKLTPLPAKPKGCQTFIWVIKLESLKTKCCHFVEGWICFRSWPSHEMGIFRFMSKSLLDWHTDSSTASKSIKQISDSMASLILHASPTKVFPFSLHIQKNYGTLLVISKNAEWQNNGAWMWML